MYERYTRTCMTQEKKVTRPKSQAFWRKKSSKTSLKPLPRKLTKKVGMPPIHHLGCNLAFIERARSYTRPSSYTHI